MTHPMDLMAELLKAGLLDEAKELAKDHAYKSPETIEERYQQLRSENRTPRMPMFWLVWCPVGPHPPKFRHGSETAAQGEAERMAEHHPGERFYVVESKSRAMCKVRPVTITPCTSEPEDKEDDIDIPF